jgi:integrase
MVWAGYDIYGKAIRGHLNFHGTWREAVDAGIELRRQRANALPDPDKYTIGTWFETQFLPYKRAQAERNALSPTYVWGLEKKYGAYIKPHPIARLRLSELDRPGGTVHLVRWFNDVANGTGATVERLSESSLHHILNLMTCALKHAQSAGPLEKDAFRKFPRDLRPRLRDHGRPSKRSIGSAGLLAIMRAFEGTEDEGEITLALLGLRRGEILGLRIRGGEEDPDNGDLVLDGPHPRVRVRQVVIYSKGGVQIKRFPKSEHSRRDVALPQWAVKVLRDAKKRTLELRLASGESWVEHDLLFPSKGRRRTARGGMAGDCVPGAPQHPNALYVRFKRRLKQVNIDGIPRERLLRLRLHDLRHTFVSVLINEAGMRAEEVQRLAGHADLKTTQHYRAEDHEAGARAAAALDRLIALESRRP